MSNLKNAIVMERIDLFDNYITNQLSDTQRAEFDTRLRSDEKFASDFKVYLLTVNGICREARQDNIDLGIAMKSLSKKRLQEIIGKQDIDSPQLASVANNINAKESKVSRFKPWIWQVASIAAVVIIAFTVVFNIEKNARDSIDNAIYACADISPDLARAGDEVLDITSMNDEELRANIPILIANYNSAESTDEIADNGYALAMAYLRLHERDDAKNTLQQLVTKFEHNSDYAGYVSKWKSILNVLK